MLVHRLFLVILLVLGISVCTSMPVPASIDPIYKVEKQDLRFAHAQHEIILLLIKDGDFNRAWEETEKLLEVHVTPATEQEMMVRSLTIIAEKFFQKGRVDLSLQVFDGAIQNITDRTALSRIHLNQARLYKTQGLNQKAIESYKKYQELAGK